MKFLWICFSALLSAAAPLSVFAADEKIIAVTEEFVPFNYTENGKLSGYSVAVAQELLSRSGLTYEMASYPWARAYQMAQTSPNVLIFTIARTAERETKFHWIGALAKRKIYLYKLAKRSDIKANKLEDVKKYLVAVNRNDAAQKTLEENGFVAGKNIDLSPNDMSSLNKLMLSRVDFITGNELSIHHLAKTAGISPEQIERSALLIDQGEYFIAMSRQSSPAVVNKLQSEFSDMRKNGSLKKIASSFHLSEF